MITRALQIPLISIVCFGLTIFLIYSCSEDKSDTRKDSTSLGRSKIVVSSKQLKLNELEGLVYHNSVLFTGSAITYSSDVLVEEIFYKDGLKHGSFKKWYQNGLLSYHCHFINGKQEGLAKSWWKNGNIRSESRYTDGVANGIQRQWYSTGEKFQELNLVNGREEGMQRTWRKNGKLYNNYEARNGRIFGLKRANLCYSIKDEESRFTSL